GAVQVRVVDQALPAHGGAGLLEVGAHDQQQVVLHLGAQGREAAGVVQPRLRVVDRAGADHDEQPVVGAGEHVTDLLAVRGDLGGGGAGQRQVVCQLGRGGQGGEAGDVTVSGVVRGCRGGGGGEKGHGSCPPGGGGPAAAEPAGNGEGQSGCSALVGSGEEMALRGGRPLRSRHRIELPTLLHAQDHTRIRRLRPLGPEGRTPRRIPATVEAGPPTGLVGGPPREEDGSMPRNVAQKLIAAHLVEGIPDPGQEIGLRVDQTLTQDATGTMVMLELEAMNLDRVRTELSVQYVDHNLLQTDWKNADDHLFLESAAQRFGLWFSKAGNGVSHPVHQAHFGRPGTLLIGSDSHTCAAGALGMLAIGVGGLEIAMAMAGQPLYVSMPEIWGVELTGELPAWVSAKDVVLEMLRRHDVKGGVGRIIEYHGEGLAQLTAMDRHVIANMGAELGATATVFPADDAARTYLGSVGRAAEFTRIEADAGATYDHTEHIDLSTLEPLIAKPSSPGNVVTVASVAGEDVSQAVVGSSANPGLRDFAVVAEILDGRQAAPGVSVDINPSSREVLADLISGGWLSSLVAAGARIHQSGCMGCIGMGQAPATGRNSLRTMPRNF